jgi:hypothetical protein
MYRETGKFQGVRRNNKKKQALWKDRDILNRSQERKLAVPEKRKEKYVYSQK